MMELKILYEDKDYVVINKPAGLVVHPDGKTKEPTVCDWILKKYPEAKDVGEPLVLTDGTIINRPGIVHRIDRDTSGVLIITKNQKAFLHLKKQFQDRTVKKTYHAFVYGEMKEEDGVIDRPIARSKKDFRLWSAQRGSRGTIREAITHYRVVEKKNGFSFIEAKPKTGRTHQIRVHFKAINHPLVCDKLYAPRQACGLGFERLALHASEAQFNLVDGKVVTVEAPFPKDFITARKKLAN